jgi:hypothetical protein
VKNILKRGQKFEKIGQISKIHKFSKNKDHHTPNISKI